MDTHRKRYDFIGSWGHGWSSFLPSLSTSPSCRERAMSHTYLAVGGGIGSGGLWTDATPWTKTCENITFRRTI